MECEKQDTCALDPDCFNHHNCILAEGQIVPPAPRYELESRVHRLESLIRWLALAYNGRTPIFAREDIYTGDPLFDAIDCEQAWHEVMGPTTPAAPGQWARCPHCLSFYVDSAG